MVTALPHLAKKKCDPHFFLCNNSRCTSQLMHVFLFYSLRVCVCVCVCVCQVLALGHRLLWLFFRQEAQLCCGSVSLLFLSLCAAPSLLNRECTLTTHRELKYSSEHTHLCRWSLFYQTEPLHASPEATLSSQVASAVIRAGSDIVSAMSV